MKIKTRLTFFAALLAVGALAFYFYDPTKTARDDETELILKVTWTPVQRPFDAPIKIETFAHGVPQYRGKFNESPWYEPITAPKGVMVTLKATQPVHGQHLDCSITVRGRTTGPSNALPNPDGTSSCIVMATA